MNLKSLKTLLVGACAALLTAGSVMAQSPDYPIETHSPGSPIGGLIVLVLAILSIIAGWKVFVKAGQPGWASLIPIYNVYVVLKIVGRPGWWLILFLIPLVNFIIAILITVDLAKSFGKGVGFAIGMLFLPFIFWLILGFGDASYKGPSVTAS